ncbi:MAG: hypothetical protein GXO25_01735 [Euryarchaeota archaeon]|nr:hypothetical protein [Euryarchaeota archaeon]
MKLAIVAIVTILLFSAGAVMLGVHEPATTNATKSPPVWVGTISVHIKKFKCDPGLDPWPDKPDPYFVVFINQHEIKSQVWDGEDDFEPNWTASLEINTRDPEVWIEISAWDDDSGLTGRDDLIDISPDDSFSLDLLYNLNTHTWTGDVSGNNASGNRPYDWGDIWFEIMSTPDLATQDKKSVNLPYSGYGRLDPAYYNSADYYVFNVSSGESINAKVLPSPYGDFSISLYAPDGTLLETSNKAGYGGIETINYTAKSSGAYVLKISTVSGYGAYYVSINTEFKNVVPGYDLNITTNHAYVLSTGWTDVNVRMMGYHVALTINNPTTKSGYVRIHFFNLDPDYVITNYENYTYRGTYSLTVTLPINATETKTILVHPWAEPKNNFWIFAMGDNRPGCGIYDHPYIQGPQYTLFTHYYTSVIRTPIGWDDGDLVSGFGGALVTEYKGESYDALDYVYDMEYNRFYMLTGTSGDFFFTTVGNHDVTRHPDQPRHAGEYIYEEYLGNLYYSFNFSNTHFVFPDDYQEGYWHHGSWTYGTNETPWWYATDPGSSKPYPHYGGYIYGKQLQWLKEDLASSQSYTHRMVVMHMPLITPPGREKDGNDSFINNTNRVEVMQIFKEYNVDYLVVAHIHNYTYYYTNLEYDQSSGNWEVTATDSPSGSYSVFTLLTGGAGAHNKYEWIVPAIEGSYHFVLIHVNGDEITYHVYKYENLTDSNGNPLTTVTYQGANNGSESEEWGVIKNKAIYNFPYIRMKFYMSPNMGHDDYRAYSNVTGTYLPMEEHKFKYYTVVYVNASVGAKSTNYVHVFLEGGNNTPEFQPFSMAMLLFVVLLIAVALRKKQ